ncbi:hypothetical protein H8S20_04265 [Clostridium sp. NSJ-6]|uniref:Uncharacterized protein n=1 Tax=Clostridium hominis TaxID=2763036 RepID=A0ABR7D9N8_9CLOT|nr:hypothetical protein [Clostridium hominis]MBC5628104.1 hypothetical protein [Clostridium hominis]MDU2673136.1 hypothetical protein [Clostridium sp.]
MKQYLEFNPFWNENSIKKFVLSEHSELTNFSDFHGRNDINSYTDELVSK